jgi:DNA-binding MarR family transcriptional regulator
MLDETMPLGSDRKEKSRPEEFWLGFIACILAPPSLIGGIMPFLGPDAAARHGGALGIGLIVCYGFVALAFVFDEVPRRWRMNLVKEPVERAVRYGLPRENDVTPDPVAAANGLLRLVQLRNRELGKLMPVGLLGDPVWEMLLDLFVQQSNNRRVSVSDLCIASNKASTTALRYITRLVDQGVLERSPDPDSKRRVLLSLSPVAMETMRSILSR